MMKLTRVCMSANHASFITTITGEEKVETWSRAGHHLHQILNYIYSFFSFIFFSITAFCIQLLSVLMAQSSGNFLTDDLKNKTKKSLNGDRYIYLSVYASLISIRWLRVRLNPRRWMQFKWSQVCFCCAECMPLVSRGCKQVKYMTVLTLFDYFINFQNLCMRLHSQLNWNMTKVDHQSSGYVQDQRRTLKLSLCMDHGMSW